MNCSKSMGRSSSSAPRFGRQRHSLTAVALLGLSVLCGSWQYVESMPSLTGRIYTKQMLREIEGVIVMSDAYQKIYFYDSTYFFAHDEEFIGPSVYYSRGTYRYNRSDSTVVLFQEAYTNFSTNSGAFRFHCVGRSDTIHLKVTESLLAIDTSLASAQLGTYDPRPGVEQHYYSLFYANVNLLRTSPENVFERGHRVPGPELADLGRDCATMQVVYRKPKRTNRY